MIEPMPNIIHVKLSERSDEWGFDNGVGLCGTVITSSVSGVSVDDEVWFLRCTNLGDGTALVDYNKCTLINKK
jgi:hypothetical protein